MNKRAAIFRLRLLLALLLGALAFCRSGSAGESPPTGNRYEIIRPMYLMVTYNSLNDRRVSKETARAYLHATRYYQKSWVAFQTEVPAGTIMTIIGPTSPVRHVPFLANRYLVQLDPDPSRGLDVVLELNRGVEGTLEGLNPEIFRPFR